MRRCEFAAFGRAAAPAWPFAVNTQQRKRITRHVALILGDAPPLAAH